MDKCKHELDGINGCTICGLTYAQIKDEWYEFVKELQAKISNLETIVVSLTARLISLEINNNT